MPTSTSVPTPIAALVGLVPTAVGAARALPGQVVMLPIRVPLRLVSGALVLVEGARREYFALADRGEDLIASLLDDVDDPEDVLENVVGLAGRRAASTYERLEDAGEDLRGRLLEGADDPEDVLENAVGLAGPAAASAYERLEDAGEDLRDRLAPEPDEAAAPASDDADPRPRTAVSPEVAATVDEVLAAAVPRPVPTHDELPLPDYDHLTLGSLRSRLRTLGPEQLVDLRAYEEAHARRLPVLTMFDNRLAKLAAGASPSGGDPAVPAPELAPAPDTGSLVTPATSGPVINPPSQGDPTNPAQPRSTG